MNNSALVRVVERVAGLRRVHNFQGERNRSAPRNQLVQVLAVNQLHGDVRHAALVTHIVDRDDVRMLKPAGGLRFAIEALEHAGIVGNAGRDRLKRNLSIYHRVARSVHDPHGAMPQFA